MFTARWYPILETHEVPIGRPLGVTRLGRRMSIWRDDNGALHAIADRCPHRGAALSPGRLVDGHVECPFHGFRFDGKGACTLIPANPDRAVPPSMRVDHWEVGEAHGFVWLWWGPPSAELPPIPWFTEFDTSWKYASFADDWDMHFLRCVENQLDFIHVPFVHRNSIGKNQPSKLAVRADLDGDLLRITYDPAVWDAGGFFVELIAPSLWRNRLADKIFGFIAFVPIDDAHTRLYVRFYQKFLTLPVLGDFVCWVSNRYNRYVLYQDKAVVLTQTPAIPGEGEPDVLVAADAPLALYRRWLRQNAIGGRALASEPDEDDQPPSTAPRSGDPTRG